MRMPSPFKAKSSTDPEVEIAASILASMKSQCPQHNQAENPFSVPIPPLPSPPPPPPPFQPSNLVKSLQLPLKKRHIRRKGSSVSQDPMEPPPDWLPKGWTEERRVRTGGKSTGHVDKFYYNPEHRQFRSRREVYRYVAREKQKLGETKTNTMPSQNLSSSCNDPYEEFLNEVFNTGNEVSASVNSRGRNSGIVIRDDGAAQVYQNQEEHDQRDFDARDHGKGKAVEAFEENKHAHSRIFCDSDFGPSVEPNRSTYVRLHEGTSSGAGPSSGVGPFCESEQLNHSFGSSTSTSYELPLLGNFYGWNPSTLNLNPLVEGTNTNLSMLNSVWGGSDIAYRNNDQRDWMYSDFFRREQLESEEMSGNGIEGSMMDLNHASETNHGYEAHNGIIEEWCSIFQSNLDAVIDSDIDNHANLQAGQDHRHHIPPADQVNPLPTASSSGNQLDFNPVKPDQDF